MSKRIIPRISAAVLMLVLLLPIFLLVSAPSMALGDVYDLSRPGFSGETYNRTFTATDLFAELSVSAQDSELKYLSDVGALSIVYPKSIPTSYVSYSHDSGILTVRAKIYTYTSPSGTSVSWLPSSVKLSSGGDASFTEDGDEFVAELPLSEFSDALTLDVDYRNTVTVPKDKVNEILLKAFDDGKAYYEANVKYLSELEAYKLALAEYESDSKEYALLLSEYEASYAVYQKYLSDKKVYDELYAEYRTYLQELSAYNADLEKYNAYLAAMEKYKADYQAYLASEEKKASLADELLAYESYLSALELVNYRLSLVESTKTNVSRLERNIYDAIMGDTVTTVIENEDIIAGNLVGANREAVEMAGKSTSWLRTLMKDYFSKSSNEEKFIYYKLNYRRFRDNMCNLFRSLDNLYENERVRDLLVANDKDEKYRILLAQLYLASLAFSDTPVYNFAETAVYDSSYKIGGVYSPSDIILNEDYYVDKNAAAPASGDVYPTEVAKPDYTPVPEPTAPPEVKEPTAPAAVSEPTAPKTVTEPTKPTEPLAPIAPTAPYEVGSCEEDIALAYSRSELSDRAGSRLSADYAVSLSIAMKKSLGASTVSVIYHDVSGKPVGTVSFESGSFAEIDYIPTKPSDERANYVFSSWVDSSGNEVDLNSVMSDISVYPEFKEEIKQYTVTWVVDSSESSILVPYGEIPQAPDSAVRAGNDSVSYTFLGWSQDGTNVQEPTAVTANARYTALFEPQYTVPLESGGAEITRTEGALFADLKSSSYSKVRIDRLLAIADGQLIFKLTTGTVTVPYVEMLALRENGAYEIEISFSEQKEYAEYFVRLYGVNGEELAYSAKLALLVTTAHSGSDLRLFTANSSKREYFRFNLAENQISFNLNTGHTVRLAKENTVSTFPSELAELFVSTAVASPGELITLSATAPDGVRIKGFYYVTAEGARVSLEGNSFIMPPQSVTVGVDAEIVYYTVSFVSDGVVISTAKYRYGETVKIPQNPSKADDEFYSYKFKSWSPEITVATADVVYTAEFEKTELPQKEPDDSLKISDGVMRIIVTAVLSVAVLAVAVIPSTVIAVSLFVKRKRLGICFFERARKNH